MPSISQLVWVHSRSCSNRSHQSDGGQLIQTSVSLNVDATTKEICRNQDPLLKLLELLVPSRSTSKLHCVFIYSTQV